MELDWWVIVALVVLAPFIAVCAAVVLFAAFVVLAPVFALWAMLLSFWVQPFSLPTARGMRRWAGELMSGDGYYPEY